jgi:sortase (surface protein transpeptidase)
MSRPVPVAALRAPVERPSVADRSLLTVRTMALARASERFPIVVAAGLVAQVYVRDIERRAAAAAAAAAKAAAPAPAPKAKAVKPTTSTKYVGKNHFWIPSLHMSYPVYSYACGRTSYPANLIYRWGCAGRNNVYLLGHAYGVMKPLHDLYVRGGLRKGMIAVFADSSGRVRSYRVTAWQVVYPTAVTWAIASQPVPSMTLQTCVGANSAKRLNVRLVAIN